MAGQPITFKDNDIVVLYGDSITEQNLYAAFIETFLITRFPRRNLKIFNFGWGGDTAPGGNGRFARDVAPVKPTVVFVNFGMNDGCYCESTPEIYDRYINGQKALAQTIKAHGAREVLLTTCPCDYEKREDKDLYNTALAKQADGVLRLGEELNLTVADIFHPMRELQQQVKQRHPGFTMIPDSIHPDPVGHLVMAYYVLRQIDGPKQVGKIDIANGKLNSSSGVTISNFKSAENHVEFDLELPFIPLFVPPEARRALDFVPLQQELNSLKLSVKGWEQYPCSIDVDGVETAVVTPLDLAAGIELSQLDGAGWTEQGRTLWNLGQARWQRHFHAWRDMGFQTNPELLATPSFEKLRLATQEFVRDLSSTMQKIAQPRRYHVKLERSRTLPLQDLEFSPAYPYRAEEFEKAFPPELKPDDVVWTKAPFNQFAIDLSRHFNNAVNCVSYGSLKLDAEQTCNVRLILGSDDGLTVFVNGKNVLARDVRRGVKLGDDEVVVALKKGRNELLFRVTQFGGAYGFALKARVEDQTRVRVV
jgi:lysophospholipase L1-like esterase